jgi:hypothetical protein
MVKMPLYDLLRTDKNVMLQIKFYWGVRKYDVAGSSFTCLVCHKLYSSIKLTNVDAPN